MKKFAALLLAIMLIAMATTASAAVTIMIGYENNPGEPIDLACNEWKRLVEEKSNGEMIVEIFPSSQLGSKDNIIDQAMAGDCVITTGVFREDGTSRAYIGDGFPAACHYEIVTAMVQAAEALGIRYHLGVTACIVGYRTVCVCCKSDSEGRKHSDSCDTDAVKTV